MKPSFLHLGMALGGLLAVSAGAQTPWTSAYTSPTATGDCSGFPAAISTDSSSASLFSIQPIISRTIFPDAANIPARITKLAFWLNPTTQKADIFVAERGSTQTNPSPARIGYYNASATPPTYTVIGTFGSGQATAYIGFTESGVHGVAVNPMTFNQDNFLYVSYSFGSSNTASATNGWRVSRFKLDPVTRMMNMASEKILLHIPAGTANRWHTAGSMRFDNFGNLYIGASDNEATANGPANTHDLRGGILRIHPDTTATTGYTIPANNFGDYWGKKWADSGLTARAAAYRDTSIVKPEIYIKGSRNPYAFGVDPNRLGWLAWAECGPDVNRGEEHNFTTKPAFSGWPFWAAGVRQAAYASSYDEESSTLNTTAAWTAFNPTTMSQQVPINNWAANTGYDTLPPMHTAYHNQPVAGCAMGGQVIRYDGRINNPDKLPPQLDNVILTTNYTVTWAAKIDTTTGIAGAATTVFTMPKAASGPSLRNSSELVQGPDGVLYVVDQSENCCGSRGVNNIEGVAKVIYKGTCKDPGLFPSQSSTSIVGGKNLGRASNVDWLRIGSTSFSLTVPGAHEASIIDVNGKVLKTFKGEGHKTYNIPTMGSGIHLLRVKTTLGEVSSVLATGGI